MSGGRMAGGSGERRRRHRRLGRRAGVLLAVAGNGLLAFVACGDDGYPPTLGRPWGAGQVGPPVSGGVGGGGVEPPPTLCERDLGGLCLNTDELPSCPHPLFTQSLCATPGTGADAAHDAQRPLLDAALARTRPDARAALEAGPILDAGLPPEAAPPRLFCCVGAPNGGG